MQSSVLNHLIFLIKKSFDLNRDLNHWFKLHWFKSANPDRTIWPSDVRSSAPKLYAEILLMDVWFDYSVLFVKPWSVSDWIRQNTDRLQSPFLMTCMCCVWCLQSSDSDAANSNAAAVKRKQINEAELSAKRVIVTIFVCNVRFVSLYALLRQFVYEALRSECWTSQHNHADAEKRL